MDGKLQRTALACFVATALIVASGSANAQVTATDAKCRSAVGKSAGKLAAAALKGMDGCLKAALKAGTSATGCNNSTPGNPSTDVKLKIQGAATKLHDGIVGKCKGGLATPAELAVFPSCPSPADGDDNGGSSASGVDTGDPGWEEVSDCETTINTTGVTALRNYVMRPDAPAIFASGNSDLTKCANTIAKNVTKAWTGTNKARVKQQGTNDKAPGPYTYTAFSVSSATLQSTCSTAITTACGALAQLDLALLHACDTTGAGIGTCACHAAVRNAGGATATAYEFDGVCPGQVKVGINGGTGGGTVGAGNGGRLTNTVLDTGWTGLGHRVDVVDGFVGRVNLNCSGGANGGADCETCTVLSNCSGPEGNCRCSNNQATQCAGPPFAQSTCGVGNTCVVAFGPPLPLSAGGSPVCVTNTIAQELVGTADAGTGNSSTLVKDTAKVFLGIGQNKPCPTCSGASVGAAGTCSGGANNNAACVTNAIHPDFGTTSYQCQPTLAGNISGSGLKVNLTLTDAGVSLAFGDNCDAPLGAQMCACGVCSGDNSVTCNGDASCAGAGLGTCEKGGTGVSRKPNSCADLTCEAAPGNTAGNSLGICNGESDAFCDGYLRQTGDGIITCTTNADCVSLNSECPGGNCGNCALAQTKKCFRNPITSTGFPGIDGAELASVFCSGPTNNTGINGAGGIPGAGRVVLDFDFTGYCSNGTTEFELGGSNCP